MGRQGRSGFSAATLGTFPVYWVLRGLLLGQSGLCDHFLDVSVMRQEADEMHGNLYFGLRSLYPYKLSLHPPILGLPIAVG